MDKTPLINEPRLLDEFWEKHPKLEIFSEFFLSGSWIVRFFTWLFMIITKLLGHLMTVSVAFIVYYVMILHGSLSQTVTNPTFADNLNSLANTIINIGPELVIPGLFVITIKSGVNKKWWATCFYTLICVFFIILTVVTLHASIDAGAQGLDEAFLKSMLLWRVIASLGYSLISELFGDHGPSTKQLIIEIKRLVAELEPLKEQLATLEVQLAERNATIQKQETRIREHETTIQMLRQREERASKEAASLRSESDRQKLLLQEKDDTIRTLRFQEGNKSEEIEKLEYQVKELQSEVSRHLDTIESIKTQKQKYQQRDTSNDTNDTFSAKVTATDDGDTFTISDGSGTTISGKGDSYEKIKRAWASFIQQKRESYTYADIAREAGVSEITVKRNADDVRKDLGLPPARKRGGKNN